MRVVSLPHTLNMKYAASTRVVSIFLVQELRPKSRSVSADMVIWMAGF